MKQTTNIEFITELMDFATSGPLMQAFVLEGLRIYSEQVKAMSKEQRDKMDNGFLGYSSWELCADEYLTALNERNPK